MRRPLPFLVLALALVPAQAQAPAFDPVQVALIYHKLSGEPLDFELLAQNSDAVRRASSFDRPDAVKAEVARLRGLLAGASSSTEFSVRVNDNISEYDHEKAEFSVTLFQPGFFVPVEAFGYRYQLVFSNAEQARAIPMAKEAARDFDTRLRGFGRQVNDEIRFKVTGKGDTRNSRGERVIQGELLSVRVLDPRGQVLFAPDLSPAAAAALAEAKARSDAAFVNADLDVAGFHVGGKGKDLEAAVNRLFGRTERVPASKGSFPGIATTLTHRQLGCDAIPGRSKPPHGSICVTAFLDGDDIVRMVKVERMFPWVPPDVFRAALVKRYGPTSQPDTQGDTFLTWGPPVDVRLGYGGLALTARWVSVQDYIDRGGNALGDVRMELQLVDARWAAAHAK
jgi:hypothetical protein